MKQLIKIDSVVEMARFLSKDWEGVVTPALQDLKDGMSIMIGLLTC
jgi:hypothetical protein